MRNKSVFSDYERAPLPASTVLLLPLDEMVRRIESIRLEEAPAHCPTCGSERAASLTFKRCPKCVVFKPVGAFGFDHSRGRPQSWCRACKAEGLADLRRRSALRAIRRASIKKIARGVNWRHVS